MIRRVLAVLHARNLEFLRDRATLGWNVLVPIALVGALALIFSGPERPLFKAAARSHDAAAKIKLRISLGRILVEI